MYRIKPPIIAASLFHNWVRQVCKETHVPVKVARFFLAVQKLHCNVRVDMILCTDVLQACGIFQEQ